MTDIEYIRPPKIVKTCLIFEDFKHQGSKERDKYAHYEPMSVDQCVQAAKNRIIIKIHFARNWTEQQMAEEEFMRAVNDYQWKNKTYYISGDSRSGMIGHDQKRGVEITLWADLTQEQESAAKKLFAELAEKYHIKLGKVERGRRLWNGGELPDNSSKIDTVTPEKKK